MHRTATRRHGRANNHYDLYADLEKIRDAFADTADDVRGKTSDMITQSIDNVKEKGFQVRDGVADYTADRPFKSLGIALLAGLAIGYLLRK